MESSREARWKARGRYPRRPAAASRWAWAFALALGLLLAPGCGEERPEPDARAPAPPAIRETPAEPADPARADAQRIFQTRCATCHGASGAGDGAGAMALQPRPRDLRDPAWQAQASDEHLRRVIVEGGPALGMSAAMPPNPDLAAQPEVVEALISLLRGFAED